MPVRIMAVHGGGPGNRPPTVDVLPLVNQVDGVGKQKPHGVVYGIPVHRSQAGSGGIVVDPVAGDVGLMTVAQRDISAVKANDGEQSNPGSRRMHDFADGVYHGPMLNVPLTHYIHVKPDQSIDIVAPAGVTINGLKIDASGNLTTPGGVTAGLGTGDAVTLQQHVHRGVVLGPAASLMHWLRTPRARSSCSRASSTSTPRRAFPTSPRSSAKRRRCRS
jgi:hypothetical protein